MLKDFVKMKNSKPLVDLIKENIMLESEATSEIYVGNFLNKSYFLFFIVYTGPLRDIRHQTIHVGGLLGESNSNS